MILVAGGGARAFAGVVLLGNTAPRALFHLFGVFLNFFRIEWLVAVVCIGIDAGRFF